MDHAVTAMPAVGFSCFQAVALYAQASQSAQQSPVLATSLSPFDGMLVPTLGSFYGQTFGQLREQRSQRAHCGGLHPNRLASVMMVRSSDR